MYHIKKHLLSLSRKRNFTKRVFDDSSLYLDRNEKFTFINKDLKNKLTKKLKNINPGLYPNLNIFYEKLANSLSVTEKNLFITEGVSGAIKSIIEVFCKESKSKIIFPSPTFAMYDVYADMFNLKKIKIKYNKNYELDYDLLLKSINNSISVVFLPNPNIPIEGFLPLNKIKKILEKCNKYNVLLVMDEVYFPFSKFSTINLINNKCLCKKIVY